MLCWFEELSFGSRRGKAQRKAERVKMTPQERKRKKNGNVEKIQKDKEGIEYRIKYRK
jgi:hypothetical protein